MIPSPNTNPDFFGKDNTSFFIGQVEDVNDPKRSNRVKVRCVGWHTPVKAGKDGLKTEDLEWAKVAMPTTYAQQSRVGGKHGLTPGCWVIGIFLDEPPGSPLVLNSFNFTAKTTSESNRLNVETTDGRIPDNIPAFAKINTNKDKTDKALVAEGEGSTTNSSSGDTSGDTTLDSSNDGECPIKPSLQDSDTQSKRSRGQTGNPEGQIYEVLIGDGFCGAVTGARDEIQSVINDLFPPDVTRFIYNDIVFNALTGERMNLNGLLNILAQIICGILKGGIQTQKAFLEDTLNRLKMGATTKAIPDRDGYIRAYATYAMSTADDFWNVAFNLLIHSLCDQIYSSLQRINNGNRDANNINNNTETVTRPETQVQNPNARCITDTILNDVELLLQDTISRADEDRNERVEKSMKELNNLSSMVNNTRNQDDMSSNQLYLMLSAQTELASNVNLDQINTDIESVSDVFGLIEGFNQFLSIILEFKFTTNLLVFNKAGIEALAKASINIISGKGGLSGCKPTRLFNTAYGPLGTIAGIADGFYGGGSSSGRGSKKTKDIYPNIGFGGKPGPSVPSSNNILCEEATTTEPQLGYGGGSAYATSLPSSSVEGARNFNRGIPNVVVVTNPGSGYLNPTVPRDSDDTCEFSFPSIYIDGYEGTPIPIVNRFTGALVGILTNPISWNSDIASPSISIIPDDNNCIGVLTDDPVTDTIVSSIVVDNTGIEYGPDTKICIIDRDTGLENGEAKATIIDGRIVDVEVINNGSGFLSAPEIVVCESTSGLGFVGYPIMGVVSKKDNPKPIDRYVEMVFCPGKNQQNRIPAGVPIA